MSVERPNAVKDTPASGKGQLESQGGKNKTKTRTAQDHTKPHALMPHIKDIVLTRIF